MNAEKRLLEDGYEEVKYLTDYSYDSALIGVTTEGRAVYDYELMIEWLMEREGWSYEDAEEWVNYNTLNAIAGFGDDAPIVINRLSDVNITIEADD